MIEAVRVLVIRYQLINFHELDKVLHALVDCCIEIFIEAYSDVVAVFH